MHVPRPVSALLATAALLAAAPALASCGTGEAGAPMPSVAGFRPGWGTADEREYVLTPASGPVVRPSTAPTRTSPVTPPGPVGPLSPEPSIAWVNDGRYLAVVTYGSGSCPDGPYGIEVVADQEIDIRLGPLFPDAGACTADLAPYVTVVELPHGITPAKPLTARFAEREVTIPAVAR